MSKLNLKASGIDGTQYILTSTAKLRVEKGIIKTAVVVGDNNYYELHFTNQEAQWNGQSLILSAARKPYEPKVFRTIDGAIADLKRLGLQQAKVQIQSIQM